MGRPFTYAGRYPTQGGNQKFAPEMATKVAEVMALRRAFDVSAPVMEERWDLDTPAPEPEPTKSLDERIAERAERVIVEKPAPVVEVAPVAPAEEAIEGTAVEAPRCESMSPYDPPSQCAKAAGHDRLHANRNKESWT
jgi:hypothetical protein